MKIIIYVWLKVLGYNDCEDNNMSKSQYRDIIENQINYNVNGYYAISPLELNNIKESSNNNFNLLSNNKSF